MTLDQRIDEISEMGSRRAKVEIKKLLEEYVEKEIQRIASGNC